MLQVNVRPGEFVGTPHVEPLMIIGDVSKLHVRVDVDEHDIPRFSPGNHAVATIKGNPQIRFPLTFVKTEPYVVPKNSLTGANTERVDTRVLQVFMRSIRPTNRFLLASKWKCLSTVIRPQLSPLRAAQMVYDGRLSATLSAGSELFEDQFDTVGFIGRQAAGRTNLAFGSAGCGAVSTGRS